MPKNPNKNLVAFITVIRMISSIGIFINPLWGFIVFLILDYFDAYFIQHFGGMGWNSYQQWDKKVDLVGYLPLVHWGFLVGQLPVFLIFFIYRIIGEILFFIFKKQEILLLFPNFIEPLFVWFVLLKGSSLQNFWFIILLAFQIIIEYYLHIFWPSYLKKNGFPRIFRVFGLTRVKNWN